MAQHYTSGMSLEEWIEIKTREKEVARSEQVQRGLTLNLGILVRLKVSLLIVTSR